MHVTVIRRPQHVLRFPQHVRTHHHVLVLHVGRDRTANAKIPVVEEIPDRTPNGTRQYNIITLHARDKNSILLFWQNNQTYSYSSFSSVFQIQFIMVFVHASQLLFIECDYPKAFAWFILMHAVMFYFLFYNFYQQSYKKRVRVRFTVYTCLFRIIISLRGINNIVRFAKC